MSIEEVKRLGLINKAIDKRIKQKEAARILDLSERQIRRLVRKLKENGETSLIHGLRGRESKRKISEKQKDLIIDKCIERYKGFGPTLAQEKLFEIEKIKISRESLRQILIESGLWETIRKSKRHRQWRERKHNAGEMVQMDGSRHKWFEDRGPECSLMGYIDDATGSVYGEFHDFEGTKAAMISFKGYVKQHDIPMSIYLDKHSTYKAQREETIEEQLAGEKPQSKFGRALAEIGVNVIYAHSPQAKGRIERLFKTFQDRVIKEMRLLKISNKEDGNRFLKKYLPKFNRKFSVSPAGNENLHRRVASWKDINNSLRIKTERLVRNDYTIAHEGHMYQLKTSLTIRGKKVIAVETLKGRMLVEYNGRDIRFKEIELRPKIVNKIIRLGKGYFKPKKPGVNHPWRQAIIAK